MTGWLGNLINGIVKTKTRDFIVTDSLVPGGDLAPDSYVSVRVLSMRLPNTRDYVVEQLYAVVHGFVTLSRFADGDVKLTAATMPDELAGVSSDHLDRIISLNKLIAGPTPYVGGEIGIQIGLFSVVQENLADTLLTTVTKLSGVIGTGFVAAAAPYVDVLQTAMQMLTSSKGNVKVEVGLDDSYPAPTTGAFAIVAADAKKFDRTQFSIEAATNHLLYKGAAFVDAAYMIFAVETSQQRADWGSIPELAAAYKALQAVAIDPTASAQKRTDALAAFRLAALTSPDLVPGDAQRLVALVGARIAALGGGKAAGFAPAMAEEAPVTPLPALSALPLYGEPAVAGVPGV